MSQPQTEPAGGEPVFKPLLLVVIDGDIALYGFVSSMRGVSYPLIKNMFTVSYSQQGIMTALLSFVGVSFCVIPGMFMRRFGLKKTVGAGFAVMILGMGSLFFAGSFQAAAGLLMILQAGFGFFEIGLNAMGVRIFTSRSALMMILLHFFFGVGAVCGPRFAGFLVNTAGLSWQAVYPLALIPVFAMLALSLAAPFPGMMKAENRNAAGPASPLSSEEAPDQIPFLKALKEPLVWIFGLVMGLISSIEACSTSWSGLYLQDVFGIDPASGLFVSAFFALYTLSRFFGGFLAEKAGYVRISAVCCLAVPLVLAASFLLGKPGIFLLPVTGLFIAPVYPTMLAISVGVFGKKAQAMSPAIISIAFSLNGLIQLGFGLSNRFLGAAWAYRSCVLYGVVCFLLTLKLKTVLAGSMAERKDAKTA
jgi:fucose permease